MPAKMAVTHRLNTVRLYSAVVIIICCFEVSSTQSLEQNNQSSEKQQVAVFGSAGFHLLREQLQQGDEILKERLDDRYNTVKEQLKEGDTQLKEQLSEGLARLKEQLKEGDDKLKEQLTAEEDWLKSKLTREETRSKEELAEAAVRTQEQLSKQQAVIDGMKKLLEQWTSKNVGQLEQALQEVSELKQQVETTRTSLQDTREKLTIARHELQTTQEVMRTMQTYMAATEQAQNASSHALSALRKDLLASRHDASTAMEAAKEAKAEVASLKTSSPRFGKLSERHETAESTKEAADFEASSSTSGSTFIRWGRSKCPANTSDLIYTGVAGGSWYNHKGGSPTHLCLTLNPELDPRGTAVPGSLAYLYGAEYDGFPAYATHDLPCAACRTRGATSVLMLPGGLTCPSGWTEQYTGLLASGFHDHPRGSDTVCLDGEPEQREGGHVDHNGDLFYLLTTQCGSLPCPPYTNAQLVTCVVCTL